MKKLFIISICLITGLLLIACSPEEEPIVEGPVVYEDSVSADGLGDVGEQAGQVVHDPAVFNEMFEPGITFASFGSDDDSAFGQVIIRSADGMGEGMFAQGFDEELSWQDAGPAQLYINYITIQFDHDLGEMFPPVSGVGYVFRATQNEPADGDVWNKSYGWTIQLFELMEDYDAGNDPVIELQAGFWG